MAEIKLELNSEKIMRDISHMIDQGVSYIDAICEYAAQNELEIEKEYSTKLEKE